VRRATRRPPQGPGNPCGGLSYLCGSELKVRSHVGDLDLDDGALVAVVVVRSVFERLAPLPALDGRNRKPKAKSPAKPGSFKKRSSLGSLRLG